MRPIHVTMAAALLVLPVAAAAKGGHGGHAKRPTASEPGAMVDHGAAATSGETHPANASAKPDASAAAKTPKKN